jgi:folate-binding protein YgfZ
MAGEGAAAVVDRAFIRVTGVDAEPFLQGQLSQDVSGGAGLSFLLDPTGKVVGFLRFGRHGDDGFLLDTDPEAGEAVVARLRRFLLRTKAVIDPVDDVQLLRVFDGPRLPQAQVATAWVPGEPVQDVLAPDAVAELAAIGATPMGAEEHERRRILAGVPRSGADIGPDTIPAEAGRWTIEAGVSFTKGCYTGQELVARIDSRGGNVPRPLRVLRLDGPVAAGAPVLDDAGAEVGHVTSAAVDVAMAPVARRVEVGAAVTVGGTAGRVER